VRSILSHVCFGVNCLRLFGGGYIYVRLLLFSCYSFIANIKCIISGCHRLRQLARTFSCCIFQQNYIWCSEVSRRAEFLSIIVIVSRKFFLQLPKCELYENYATLQTAQQGDEKLVLHYRRTLLLIHYNCYRLFWKTKQLVLFNITTKN
jgi:hypothetical protein